MCKNVSKPEFSCSFLACLHLWPQSVLLFVTLFFFQSEHSCCLVSFLLWFDHLSCVSSLLFSSPLLTFDLSDLETSVDSRCTTDSADSAFIGRRYWFPASSFFTISLLQSSSSILSHTGSKITNQAAGTKKKLTSFSWYFPPSCYFVDLLSIFLVIYIRLFFHLSVPTSTSPIPGCIGVFVSTVCLYVCSCLLYYMGLYVSESLHLCIIHIFTLQTPHLCLCILFAYI